jgi:hypothetical protein
MSDLIKFHRASRVFLPRLPHGTDAGEVLRWMADELNLLAAKILDDFRARR